MSSAPFRFAISATFTAEPLEPVLQFWAAQLGRPFEVRFANYNQVRQTLASPSSEFFSNSHGLNVVLARVEDLGAPESLRTNLEELFAAFEAAQRNSPVPMALVFCPPSPEFAADPESAQIAREAENRATPINIEAVDGIASPEGDRLGRVPYTELYFCALGTALVRYADALSRPPLKVIALDCDNTLWQGVCGEDGPLGIAPDLNLQRLMLQQRETGMLLTMVSKNNEQDVLDTFAQNPHMPLQLHHFAAWRLNWEEKPDNLRSLAAELSLGLDSFIFVDDSPKETAEMRQSIPETVTITLPADLNRVWAFERTVATDEDRKRNQSVAQNREFGRELKQAGSLRQFMDSLDLRLTFGTATSTNMGRIAQLTQRTNQFNFTGIRRTEAELTKALAGGLECMTVNVADRFGEYGLTGVVLYREAENALQVDTFLLSCRVLGRGVEHRVLAHIAGEAVRRGIGRLALTVNPTPKNRPAQQFSQLVHGLPVEELQHLHWTPEPQAPEQVVLSATAPSFRRPDYQAIALSAEEVLRALRSGTVTLAPNEALTGTEHRLAEIWAALLGHSKIMAQDNFFDLGGHSLLMVQMVMRVREAFGVDLTVDDVYSATLTLEELAQKIERHESGGAEEYDALLSEISAMSDEEVERLLQQEQSSA